MKYLKIAVLGPSGYNGMAYYYYSLCQGIALADINVRLYTSREWILAQHPHQFELNRYYQGLTASTPLALKGIWYILSSIHILYNIVVSKVNVVHFQASELPHIDFIVMGLLKVFRKKIIFTPHDIPHTKKYPLIRLFTKLQYRLSDTVIVHKSTNIQAIQKEFGVSTENVVVIPHGNYEFFVDPTISLQASRKKLNLPSQVEILLFFGTIKPGKGIDVLIPALAKVVQKRPNLRPVIAGRPCGGLTSDWLKEQLKTYDIEGKIILRDQFIPDEEVQFYYHASDVVVLPYTQISESGVIKYAQSCGKPVICSDLPEFKETVTEGETGLLFPSGDADVLAEKIHMFFTQCDAQKMRELALDSSKQYSWGIIANKTLGVYKRQK